LQIKAALYLADKANEYPRRGVFANPWDTAMDIVDFGPPLQHYLPQDPAAWRALARASRHPGVCYSNKALLAEDMDLKDLVSRRFQSVYKITNAQHPTGLNIKTAFDVKLALVTWMFWFHSEPTIEANFYAYWQYCQSIVWADKVAAPCDARVTPIYPLHWPAPCAMYVDSMTLDPPFVDGAVGLYSCCICNQYVHYEQVLLCQDCCLFRCKGGCAAFDKTRPTSCELCLIVYNMACSTFVSQQTELNMQTVAAATTLAFINVPVALPKPVPVIETVQPPMPPPLPKEPPPQRPVVAMKKRSVVKRQTKLPQSQWEFYYNGTTFNVTVRKGLYCNSQGFMEPAEEYHCLQWNLNLRRLQADMLSKKALSTLKTLPCVTFHVNGQRVVNVKKDVFGSFVQQCLR
jgi:hypothetical protein